jgi:hypothetical protein
MKNKYIYISELWSKAPPADHPHLNGEEKKQIHPCRTRAKEHFHVQLVTNKINNLSFQTASASRVSHQFQNLVLKIKQTK